MNRILAASVLAAAATLTADAQQQPRLANARLETRSAASGLESAFRAIVDNQSNPAWIGYALPVVSGEHHMCCWGSQSCCAACALEGGRPAAQQTAPTGPVRLEGARYFLVLFRVEQRSVGKIRNFSEGCELDAGGLPFYWLTEVRPEESIALLSSFALAADNEPRSRRHIGESAVSAIALHGDPAADRTLEQFVTASQPDALRQQAAFWLGSARGRRGYEVLTRLVHEDSSDRLREKAVFALSVSKQPEALDVIIDVARHDGSPHVRGQALFWLAQKAGRKAAEAITDAIAADPETQVKKRAVFALSQLPKDEGVRLLIEVARTNRNPVVRKEAIFWLGQSRDPRALDFLEQILKR